MKKCHFIFLLLIISVQHVLAQNPFVTNYTIENGLPSNKIYCVFQDSKNFMWFGSDNGVVRFDGRNIIQYRHEDGVSDYSVIRLKEDLSGRLWLLNLNGTVNYIYNNTIYNKTNAPFLKDLKSNQILRDFYQDPSDSLLYFYNISSEVFVVKNNQFFDYRRFKRNTDEDLSLLLLQKTKSNKFLLWSQFGSYQTTPFDGPLELKPKHEQLQKAFLTNTKKTATINNDGYLSLYDENNLIQKDVLHCNSVHVNSILIDHEGFIWISTIDKGIYCYKNDSIILHLNIKLAQTLIEDHENNIWVSSMSEGVFKINRNILKYGFLDRTNFDNKGITGINKSNDGGIWLANGTTIYKLKDDQLYESSMSVNSEVINQLYQLKTNTLLAKGTSTGLFVINNIKTDGKLKKVSGDEPKRLLYSLNKLSIDSNETTVYSFENDVLIFIKINENYSIKRAPINKGRIKNISLNKDNELIINTNKNYLTRHDQESKSKSSLAFFISPYTILENYNEKKIVSHFTIANKYELFNFEGNNLILQDSVKTIELFDKKTIHIDQQIKDLFYADSTLFFCTAKTVYYISHPLNILNKKQTTVNRININFKSINAIYCNKHKLYIATNEGLTSIPIVDVVHAPNQTPKPYIYQVSLDNEKYDGSLGQIEFKKKDQLSIEFSSLNFTSIPSNYAYKLEGIDKNWTNGNETRVVYLNLAPGEYIFKLKARTNQNNYSEITELPIIVNPTLFQRTSTKILVGLIILALVFLIVRFSYRSKIKQKETDHLLISLEHKALQSMMNPHFIFNALGSIQGYLLQNKSTEAGTYLSQFARLIRQNMNSLKSNYICIDEEIERLRNYIDLEKLRMNNRFDFEIIVDDKLDSYEVCIPSMTVQPFVENAIWHGISSLNDGGKIKVVFNSLNDQSIEVLVEDNGVGIKNSKPSDKSDQGLNMGMALTKKRLRIIGERYGVKSEIFTTNICVDEEFPGTQIKIIIPIVEGKS